MLLSIFKMADTDGHEDLADVPWFIEAANANYLHEKGKDLPIPDRAAIESNANKVITRVLPRCHGGSARSR